MFRVVISVSSSISLLLFLLALLLVLPAVVVVDAGGNFVATPIRTVTDDDGASSHHLPTTGTCHGGSGGVPDVDETCQFLDRSDDDEDDDSAIVESSLYQVTSPATTSMDDKNDEDDPFGRDIGEAQVIDPKYGVDEIGRIVREARTYVRREVFSDDSLNKFRDLCRNKNSQCAVWAHLGECEKNPGT